MTKNGFTIEKFMTERLGLSGNELVAYAYLYDGTQQGKDAFVGGYSQIAGAMGVTIPTAYNVLRKLKEKGVVEYEDMTRITLTCDF